MRKGLTFWLSVVGAVVGIAAAVVAVLEYANIRPWRETEYGGVLRVNYVRLRGSMAEMMINGLLDESLDRTLGGPHDIVQNEVLESAQQVFAHFSRPLNHDLISYTRDGRAVEPIDLREYVQRVSDRPPPRGGDFYRYLASNREWTTYLGGSTDSFFVPDVEAIDTFLNTEEYPSGYRVLQSTIWDESTSRERSIPTLWRFMTQEDLRTYEQAMARYHQRFTNRTAGDAQNYMVSGLRWLASEELPDEFILVTGAPAMHGGWETRAVMPDLEVEVAVLENVGEMPMAISALQLRRFAGGLRRQSVTDDALTAAESAERPLIASNTLAPGERIIVPTRVTFITEERSHQPQNASYEPIHGRPDLVQVPITTRWEEGGNVLVVLPKARERAFENAVPPPGGMRFDYGSSWSLESVLVNGERTLIRRADWQNASLYFGSERGSCPYIFSRNGERAPWINEGHMLIGATREDLSRTESLRLSQFDGTVQIRELEDETAFLHSIRVAVREASGELRYLTPSDVDQFPIVVGPNQSVTVRFEGYVPGEHSAPELELSGYYLPYAMLNTERLIAENH